MQECIDTIYNKSSSIIDKQLSIKKLNIFKQELIDFCNEETIIEDNDNDINENNIDTIIDELQTDIQELSLDDIEDVKQLFTIKNKIHKCNDILRNMKPQIILCEDEDIDITNAIKSKFTIASTFGGGCISVSVSGNVNNVDTIKSKCSTINNRKMIQWEKIDKCYQNDTLIDVINSKYRHENTGRIIYPKVNFNDSYNTITDIQGNKSIINVNDNDHFEMLLDSNNYLIYMFIQYESQIFCMYYTNNTILNVVCNNGIANLTDNEGIYIEFHTCKKLFTDIRKNVKNVIEMCFSRYDQINKDIEKNLKSLIY